MGSPSVLLVVVSRFCVQEVLQFQSSCFLRRVDMSSFPVSDLVVRKEAGHEYLMFTRWVGAFVAFVGSFTVI